ncbi:unnamed protein product [Allacma fusca]|uniref:Large ribosomal subunit protein bL19m n=1 Tax=Allacma fusca TaxID=39272 RepID=A0A8J2KXK7_9HEXA|nr:unnamed protein product [Allacma fusca]
MWPANRVANRQLLAFSRSIWKSSTQSCLPNPSPQKDEEDRNGGDVKNVTVQKVSGGQGDNFAPFRFVYPEFLPDPRIDWRNRIREKLERVDMLKRRSVVEIPEFYVGSIMKVSVSDLNAPGKANTFVGICTERGGCGLRANFVLRNVIDGQGVEISYEMYNPTIQSISVLRLEKRLDENLRYLRDCPIEYSAFPFDMPQEIRNPDDPVPVNTMKVKLKPKPWCAKWQLWDLKGVEDFSDQLEEWQLKKLKTYNRINNTEHEKYDLMKIYRKTIPAEEQSEIFGEVHHQLAKLTQVLRSQKRKRQFAKPQKQA